MSGLERYTLVKNVFLAASRLPKGERTGYLNAQCEGDPALASEVRALLNAEEREPAFLETPALDADGLPPGSRLGSFRIVRLLGEGGMGVVYEAKQDEPGRRVALKIIRPGFLSARLRARFRHEIRTLGQLRHPGIAQIYEAGTLAVGGEDVPYFAMELVEGKPLAGHGDDRRWRPPRGGGEDKAVRLWDYESGVLMHTLQGHAGNVTALAFDPSGRVLVSAATDLSIRLWDAESGRSLCTLAGHTGRIRSLKFTAEGRRFMSMSDDTTIRIWDVEDAEELTQLRGHSAYIYSLAFSPDGSRLVSGSGDSTVRV